MLILSFTCAACSRTKGGGDIRYLLPWRDANGIYRLQEVTLTTLISPYELKGGAAEIYNKSSLTDSGYGGSIARPHLTHSGDVYVPLDVESSIAISVYAQLEHIYFFEQRLGVTSQVSWPRKVGVELNMNGRGGTVHDNAHYFTRLDVMGLLPYTATGVPLSLNHGIVAHEHFHAHFQRQVIGRLHHVIESTISSLERLFYPTFNVTPTAPLTVSGNPTSETLNNFTLRAWNEGLADLFAAIYTGSPDIFGASLPARAAERALDVRSTDGEPMAHQVTNESQAYYQGTLLARLLYKLAISGVETPEQFASRILSHLGDIALAIDGDFATNTFPVATVVPILLKGFAASQEGCESLKLVLDDAVVKKGLNSCSNL